MSDFSGTTRAMAPGGRVVFQLIPPGMDTPVPVTYYENFTAETRTAPNGDVVRRNGMGDVGQIPRMYFLFTQDDDGSIWLHGVEGPDGAVEWVSRPDSGKVLNYPGHYETGVTWVQDFQLTGPSGPGPAMYLTHTVGEVEDVSVPLGTYRAFKIVSIDAGGNLDSESWFAPELGVNIKKLSHSGQRPGYALATIDFGG